LKPKPTLPVAADAAAAITNAAVASSTAIGPTLFIFICIYPPRL
jgi:hypothetical protein